MMSFLIFEVCTTNPHCQESLTMSYTQLTPNDRYVIDHLVRFGLSYREIGRRLDRHHTTIMREVTRNLSNWTHAIYNRDYAAARVEERRRRPQHGRRHNHAPLVAYVHKALAQCWSPEQIAKRLPLDFPDDLRMRVAPETLYTWIYKDASEGGTLYRSLRRSHRKRRKQRRLAAARRRFQDQKKIHDRPGAVDTRTRFGDWEGDSVLGAMGKGSVVTLLERKSRTLMVGKLRDRTAKTLSRQTNRLMKPLPKDWRKTLTLDNGSEFARFKAIETALKLDIYFADPYAAWQRGANENANGLLRQYFPKGCDFTKVTKKQLDKAVKEINNRPRKCLGFRTPNEVRLANNGALQTGF
jgi:IS30 family transposase